jgi:hypothetical protein
MKNIFGLQKFYNFNLSLQSLKMETELARLTIGLTSIDCKIMEKILVEPIYNHLYEINLITDSQHGFVQAKSCITNLLETMDFITENVRLNKRILLIFLDFEKAFDKLPHAGQLEKIKQYGITGKLHKWIKEFLTDRKQRVLIGEHASKWLDVHSGVPQGSVLGPLLSFSSLTICQHN